MRSAWSFKRQLLSRGSDLHIYPLLKQSICNKVEGLKVAQTSIRSRAPIGSEDLELTTGEAGL